MNYEEIKQLMEDMEKSTLTSIDIALPDGTKITMTKDSKQEAVVVNSKPCKPVEIKEENKNEQLDDIKGNIVKSPMVGNFYLKPSPTSEAYVQIGSDVKQGDILCIIEAMKLMNEIESEFSGRVKEILVKDGQPVEYGTPLFIIE